MLSSLSEHHDISSYTGYRTPATARYFYEFHSLEQLDELRQVFIEVHNQWLPLLVISEGTNMLFAFDEWPGVVVQNSFVGYQLQDTTLLVNAGHNIWALALELEDKYGTDIWHRFIGLPGSIGWAIVGNAGCFGLEVRHNFISCRAINTHTGELHEITSEEMKFEYRSTKLKSEAKWFVIDAIFDLSQRREKYSSDVDNVYFREHQQPKWLSCGSFFKNPSREQPAGLLIEEAGLKGHHIGWAFFSDQHSNFLMSDGTATWQELMMLIELAKSRVREESGIELVNEVRIITPNYAE